MQGWSHRCSVYLSISQTAFHVFGFELLFSLGFVRDCVQLPHPGGASLRNSLEVKS